MENDNKRCSIEECLGDVDSHRLCSNHAYRLRKYGDPRKQVRIRRSRSMSDEDAFWARVDKTPGQGPNGDCWIWLVSEGHSTTYGATWVNGKNQRAHCYSYFLANGKWPEYFGCHTCEAHIKLAEWLGLPNDTQLDSESGFFALLDGLRAKGFEVECDSIAPAGTWDVRLYLRDVLAISNAKATADTLPQAVFQAAIKAMEAEDVPKGEE